MSEQTTTYLITETNETTASGDGFIPTSSERSYTVEAKGAPGNTKDATQAFFRYAQAKPVDPWGNPKAENGVELTESPDSCGRFWTGRIRWEFPSATSYAATNEAYGGADPASDGSTQSEALRWYPFVSGFSIAGGTKHMTVSYNTRAYAINGTVVDFDGGIGWDGEGFEGCDVPCPAVNFEITARTPEGFIGNFATFLNKILPYVGTVNSDKFYGCDPGTVLFNGITSGSLKSGTSSTGSRFSYWEMTYSFSAMPNATINVDGVAVPKGGWEYMWHLVTDSGAIRATYVEQVMPYSVFKGLGLVSRPNV